MPDIIETLDQGLDLFETVGMPARNLASNTRHAYRRDLEELLTFLASQGVERIDQVTLPHLEAFQAKLDRRGYKASTRERKTYAVKSFFNFLHRQGVLATNVAIGLIPPRPEKIEPRFLSKDEYQALLRACSHRPRDAAIIEVFLQTGMRLAELANLQLSDIELPKRISKKADNTGSVRIKRKGSKEETIPLNYKACQALAAWLKVRPDVDNDALFVTKFKTPISRRTVQYLVNRYLAEAGIEGASVHTLRHTMATHHVIAGTDLKTVQETLGHANLSTTALYVSLAKKAQRQALQENAL